MEKKLEVKNLKISFRTQGGKVQAVRDISFDLYKGETLALVGESGSGKSVTNRAIIGILAGNAIVEGGEILYDGQDLLKVSEEEFHKLRGDKIAMIFQDPMSSLNPIMRVGKQLTEAMLLKGRASQRNARNEFNAKLALLRNYMDKADGSPEAVKKHASLCKTFDNFCISATKMESVYNEAMSHIIEMQSDIENILFLIEKNQVFDRRARLGALILNSKRAYNDFLIKQGGEFDGIIAKLRDVRNAIHGKNSPAGEEEIALLKRLNTLLKSVMEAEKPNFFCLGYYQLRNPEFVPGSMPVHELNTLVLKYIDEEFMLGFIEEEKISIKTSFDQSLNNKKSALELLSKAKTYFSGEIEKAECAKWEARLKEAVLAAIDPLMIRKDSTAYTFSGALHSAIEAYFAGIHNNPAEQARFEKQNKKHEKLSSKGREPGWKVVPPSLVDLDAAHDNIVHIIENLEKDFSDAMENAPSADFDKMAIDLIDYFKAQASAVVYKVTRRLAKVRALKLLEEVGIPEPAVRYRQYPFEFSGGMRQRIVIAIALAADPDILICDEPTTALDVTIQSQILELINRIKAERQLSVIFITHDLGVVANMADRIAVMYAGKIVEYGTADDIFYDSRHPYTWALLSSMPDLDTKDKLEAIPGTPPNMIYPPKGDAFAARNKYALEIDYELEPPMFRVSDTHYAATWLLHPDAPKVEPPQIVKNRIQRALKEEANQNE